MDQRRPDRDYEINQRLKQDFARYLEGPPNLQESLRLEQRYKERVAVGFSIVFVPPMFLDQEICDIAARLFPTAYADLPAIFRSADMTLFVLAWAPRMYEFVPRALLSDIRVSFAVLRAARNAEVVRRRGEVANLHIDEATPEEREREIQIQATDLPSQSRGASIQAYSSSRQRGPV